MKVRITNALGKQKTIPERYLKKIQGDFKEFIEILEQAKSFPESIRQELNDTWTITKVEILKESLSETSEDPLYPGKR